MGIGCWRVTVSALTHYPVWLLLLVAALSLPCGIGGWVGVYFWRLFSMMVYDLILCGGGMAGSAVLQGPLSFFVPLLWLHTSRVLYSPCLCDLLVSKASLVEEVKFLK